MSNNKIGPWEYYPSILELLKEKVLIEEDVNKLLRLKTELARKNGGAGDFAGLRGSQEQDYRDLLIQIGGRLNKTIRQTEALGEAEDKQYETAKSLMSALKNLEANIVTFKEDAQLVKVSRRGATAEALDNSVISANSAFLEIVLMMTGLIFLLILCATTGLTKDATTVELLFAVGVLLVIAYFLYDYFSSPTG